MEFYSFQGLRNGGTFFLDEATKEKIKDNPNQICGKVITLTDHFTAGYGKSGDAPRGFVEMVEHEQNFSEKWVVSVVWNRSIEGIPCTGSELVTDKIACDGNGGIMKGSEVTKASLLGIKDDNLAAVYISG